MPDTSKCRRLTPEEARELLRLREEEGLSYARLAARFNISWSSARDRIYRDRDPRDPARLAAKRFHRAALHARAGRVAEAIVSAEGAALALSQISSLPSET